MFLAFILKFHKHHGYEYMYREIMIVIPVVESLLCLKTVEDFFNLQKNCLLN